MDFAANRSTVASQQRTVSVSFCRGGCKFRSSAGYRKNSLASSQFTLILGLRIRISSSGTARKTGDTIVFTFENSTKRRLIFQENFFYNPLVANWRLSSKFQSPNIFFHLPKWSQLHKEVKKELSI